MAERLAVLQADFEMHYCTRSAERTAFRNQIAASSFANRVRFHMNSCNDARRPKTRFYVPNSVKHHASIREGQAKIFSEDLEMLERQQRNLLANPDRPLLKLNIDAGGVRSRRVLDRIIALERAA